MSRTETGRFFPLACAFYLALAVGGILGSEGTQFDRARGAARSSDRLQG